MATDEEKESPYRPFHPTPVEPKYGRDRGFAVTHTRLDLTIDTEKRTVVGTALIRIQPFSGLREFELDAEDLAVRRVKVDGVKATFESHDRKLLVRAPKRLKEAQVAEVFIEYEARPRRGLYFITPSKHYPKKPIQVWTQGESEDNHAWFPGYDHPNNKATSEVLIAVRDPLVAVSNGHLEGEKKVERGWTQYHWVQDVPQPNYLIALVIGRFDEITAKWRDVPLSYLVPMGKKDWGKETFKNTPAILEFFSKVTGYPYPFPKYAQAVIADFMWGGMENTTITTVNERFLIGPEHREDANPDGLIAHEAAHQWFGDLITTKTWDHLWLNEGFATYFDALFHEAFYGKDWFQTEMLDNAAAYFAEDGERYRRPIVTRNYLEPEDLFDRHTYQKGSLVLHMLRKELGEEAWWKSIRHYVKKFEYKNVETGDLRIAIEEATGRNLEWFFDQWLHKAGHPELEASWTFDARERFVKLSMKQTQKVVGETPLFRLNFDVRIWTDKTKHVDHAIKMGKPQEAFYLPVSARPSAIEIDPDGWVLKKLTFTKEAKEWAFQLEHGTSAHARIEAAEELAKKVNDPVTVPSLTKALTADAFWGVRRAAAGALGELRSLPARDALKAGLKDKNPLVRRGTCAGLGNFRNDRTVAEWLLSVARRDRSDYVRAGALHALARTHDKRAFAALRAAVREKSHNDVVASTALSAFQELRDLRALPILIQHTELGRPAYQRFSATVALGRLWEFGDKKQQADVRDTFQRLLRDPLHAQRRAALVALRTVNEPELVALAEEMSHSDPIGLLRNLARETLRLLRERMGSQARLGDLRKRIDEIGAENKKLKASVGDLEARLAAHGLNGRAKRRGARRASRTSKV